MFILLMIVFLNFSSATQQTLGTFQQNENINLIQTCGGCNSLNISTIVLPNSSLLNINTPMTKSGNVFNYSFNQTDSVGEYIVNGNNENNTIFTYNFFITPNGKELNIQTALIQILLILFFVSILFLIHYVSVKVNLEKWNNSLKSKYRNRNYVKFILGSLGYNFIKNSFILYYLVGLPIIITLTDLSNLYGLDNLTNLFKTIVVFYFVGIIILGVVFLGYIQEWFMDLLNNIKDMEWGIER